MTYGEILPSSKRRRVVVDVPPAAAARLDAHGGFLDRCRLCHTEILRKGQSRPRICLDCEKKKSAPIMDVCKDCRDPIVRSNVRKARICPKCKKHRERLKPEQSSAAAAVAAAAAMSVYGTIPSYLAARKVYSAKNRLDFVLQWQRLAEMLQSYGGPSNAAPPLDDCPLDTDNLLPCPSGLPKIDTTPFSAPEDIVEHVIQAEILGLPVGEEISLSTHPPIKQEPREETEEEEKDEEQTPSPILVPHINPFVVTTTASSSSDGGYGEDVGAKAASVELYAELDDAEEESEDDIRELVASSSGGFDEEPSTAEVPPQVLPVCGKESDQRDFLSEQPLSVILADREAAS